MLIENYILFTRGYLIVLTINHICSSAKVKLHELLQNILYVKLNCCLSIVYDG